MKFNLRLTNRQRLRWLLGGWAAFLPLSVLLPSLHLGWLLVSYCLALLVPLVFYSWLLRQAAWVLVAADSITWANPADNAPMCYPFSELRAYRFEMDKNDNMLILYPKEGEEVVLYGRLHKEFLMMEMAFRQAIRRYNQDNPGAEVAWEPSTLTKFFTSRLSTQVLWGLLALEASAVGWGISHDAPGPAYLPLLLVGLPYLIVWANFYYERP